MVVEKQMRSANFTVKIVKWICTDVLRPYKTSVLLLNLNNSLRQKCWFLKNNSKLPKVTKVHKTKKHKMQTKRKCFKKILIPAYLLLQYLF